MLVAYWLGFRKIKSWQAHQDLEVHPSSLALDSQAAWNSGIIWVPSQLVQEVVIAEEVVKVVCHLVLVLHEPLHEPLLQGRQEVSPRQTSITPLFSSWSKGLC